jgi:hypothetical protein
LDGLDQVERLFAAPGLDQAAFLPCQSHYWIENNRVRWAARWTRSQIKAGRAAEERAGAEYYGEELARSQHVPASQIKTPDGSADAVQYDQSGSDIMLVQNFR